MTRAEMALSQQLSDGVDSLEQYFNNADVAPVISQRPSGAKMAPVRGNPLFSAQFDVSFALRYFTVVTATGIYTQIAAAGLSAALKTQLPVFIFGNSDFASGFSNIKQAFPLNTWVYGRPGIFGKDDFSEFAFDAFVTANLITGDLVMPFTSDLPGAGTTTVALAIVRCSQVAYGTLLDALNSDRFVMNMIRYNLPDTTQVAQYNNNIGIFNLSLFGKFNRDFVSPNSYKKPEQFQNGFIDVPLKLGIAKQDSLGMYVNYTTIDITWSIFVWTVRKLTENG